MTNATISIRFDRPDRVYRGGDTVAGSVDVTVPADVAAAAITLAPAWRTLGRGNVDRGRGLPITLATAQTLEAGQTLSLPFAFFAPVEPLSYRGTLVQIEHFVRAEVAMAWARDPAAEAVYVVAPGLPPPELSSRHEAPTKLRPPSVQLPLAVKVFLGVLFVPMVLVALAGSAVVLVPILVVAGVIVGLRRMALKARLDTVEATLLHRVVAPGEACSMTLRCTPRKTFAIRSISLVLTGRERVTSGSAKNQSRRLHLLAHVKHEVRGAGQLLAGAPVDETMTVRFPDTEAYSFEMPSNAVAWQAELRIAMPWFPDWTRREALRVVPAAWAQRLGAAPMPAPATGSQPRGEVGVPVAAEPGSGDLPAHANATPPASIDELVARLQALPHDRAEVIASAAGVAFPVTVLVDRITTGSAGRDSDDASARGRAVAGTLDPSRQPIEVLMLDRDSDAVGRLRRGTSWAGVVQVVGWDNLYKRLRTRQVERQAAR